MWFAVSLFVICGWDNPGTVSGRLAHLTLWNGLALPFLLFLWPGSSGKALLWCKMRTLDRLPQSALVSQAMCLALVAPLPGRGMAEVLSKPISWALCPAWGSVQLVAPSNHLIEFVSPHLRHHKSLMKPPQAPLRGGSWTALPLQTLADSSPGCGGGSFSTALNRS